MMLSDPRLLGPDGIADGPQGQAVLGPAWGHRVSEGFDHYWTPAEPEWKSLCGLAQPIAFWFQDLAYVRLVIDPLDHCKTCEAAFPAFEQAERARLRWW